MEGKDEGEGGVLPMERAEESKGEMEIAVERAVMELIPESSRCTRGE